MGAFQILIRIVFARTCQHSSNCTLKMDASYCSNYASVQFYININKTNNDRKSKSDHATALLKTFSRFPAHKIFKVQRLLSSLTHLLPMCMGCPLPSKVSSSDKSRLPPMIPPFSFCFITLLHFPRSCNYFLKLPGLPASRTGPSTQLTL